MDHQSMTQGNPTVVTDLVRNFELMQNRGEVLTDFQYRFFVLMHETEKGLEQ